MNYKYLILLVLLIILIFVLVKNKKELFQNNSNGDSGNNAQTDTNTFCNGENDVKYVIFYPRGSEQKRENAKAMSCNITKYNNTTGMFEFNKSEKSSIAVELGDVFKIKLSSKIEGIGPVFTGASWVVTATDNYVFFESGGQKLQIERKTEATLIELSYDKLEQKLKFRLDSDDTTAKEIDIADLKFNRFDIGKDETTHFRGSIGDRGYIGNIIIDESSLTISTEEERGDADFDKLLNFLLSINPEGFKDYKEEINTRIEHFQSNLDFIIFN